MTSVPGRSVTPSRRYGDIIGSIFSNGSIEIEEKKKSSISQVKQKFRERRQKSSPGRSLSRHSTPERRQMPSSPIRQFNEMRNDGRPPTPDRNRSNNRPRTPDRRQFQSQNQKSIIDSLARGFTRNNTLSALQLEPFQILSKGTSAGSLSLSPTNRSNRGVDSYSSVSVESLTNRVAKQMSKEMEKTTEQGQKVVETRTPEPSEPESEQLRGSKQETIEANVTKIDQQREYTERNLISEGSSAKTGPEAGASEAESSISSSPEDAKQIKDIIQAQHEQIKFYEKCLNKRSNDIEQLAFELELSKKNESKLNLELEIHDLKYSMYDDYRRMMDRQKLDSTYHKEGDEIEKELESSFFSKSYDAFSKLNHLDQLYEMSKLEAESRFSLLQEEYIRVISTRSLLDGETPRNTSNTTSLNTGATSTNLSVLSDLLENRIKILESENLKYALDIKRKEEELEKAKSVQKESSSRKEENLFNTHNLEKQTLQNKIIALETEIGFTSGHIDDKTRTRRYRALEKNLNDYVTEIMGLEDQLKAKENVISKLKEMDLALNSGLEKRNGPGSHLSVSSAKWYERSNNIQKGRTMSSKSVGGWRMPIDRLYGLDYASEPTNKSFEPNSKDGGKGMESSKTLVGDKIDAVSTDILRLKTIGGSKIGSRNSINRKGPSSSSARIAMLRKRLDALANDHSSVCTDDTQFSSKTSPP
jgi:hypothetical protein